jgi:hypothetical protein
MGDRGMSRTWFKNSVFGRPAFSGAVKPWREKYRLNDTRLNSLQSLLEPAACAAAGVCDCSEQTRAISPSEAQTRVDDAKASGAAKNPSDTDRSPSAQRTVVVRRVIIVLLLQMYGGSKVARAVSGFAHALIQGGCLVFGAPTAVSRRGVRVKPMRLPEMDPIK